MSKPIQYDSLLVNALAATLRSRYRGARVRAIRFDGETRTVRVLFARRSLVWCLDPAAGGLWEEPLGGPPTGVVLPKATAILDVVVAPDDRLLEFRFGATSEDDDPRVCNLWIELLPSRRNAILTQETRVLGALHRLPQQVAGPVHWTAPEPRPRQGADQLLGQDEFSAILGAVPPPARRSVLLRAVAWTSPINADAILGDAARSADTRELERCWSRYHTTIVSARAGDESAVLDPGVTDQPYPAPLDGIPSRPAASLLHAFEEVAPVHRTRSAEPDPAEILRRLQRRLEAESGKLDRLIAELGGAGRDAERLRRHADLLLGQLHAVRRGQTEAVLDDWQGGRVTVPLDPALDAAGNANALYEQARKRQRAAQRLPAMVESARRRADRLQRQIQQVEAGQIDAATAAALLPPAGSARRKPGRPARALPYRVYRTSGGLEVRVGRGSRANDELTLHHSSPEDVWLHARDVAGAHVILRWGRREENPPATEIAQAAVLAALHSRARTSGAVPVDWTRRKHVRKPRKAPPGQVTMERARTVFVEPDASIEEKMRVR